MLVRVYRRIKWDLDKWAVWAIYKPALERARTREEFENLVGQARPSDFLFYRTLAEQKRVENRALLDYLGFDLVGKRCVDIGPGHGESLDVWHERGASECAFVEVDEFLFHHNRLKPFTRGWKLDQFKGLDALPLAHFDLIWSRGSFGEASFRLEGRSGFVRWLSQVERLAAPGATIGLCPSWQEGPEHKITRPEGHWMARAVEERGYRALPFIEGHNRKPQYPITWVRSGR